MKHLGKQILRSRRPNRKTSKKQKRNKPRRARVPERRGHSRTMECQLNFCGRPENHRPMGPVPVQLGAANQKHSYSETSWDDAQITHHVPVAARRRPVGQWAISSNAPCNCQLVVRSDCAWKYQGSDRWTLIQAVSIHSVVQPNLHSSRIFLRGHYDAMVRDLEVVHALLMSSRIHQYPVVDFTYWSLS